MWEKLVDNFLDGCEDGALVLQDSTPIDTMRLYESTRVEIENISKDRAAVRIVQGGVELYGIIRERDILKRVDYGLYVIARNNYIRANIEEIKSAIINRMTK